VIAQRNILKLFLQHAVFPAWQAAQNPAKNIVSRSHAPNFAQVISIVEVNQKTVWDDLVRSGTFWYVLARSGPIWADLVRFGPFRADLGRSGPFGNGFLPGK